MKSKGMIALVALCIATTAFLAGLFMGKQRTASPPAGEIPQTSMTQPPTIPIVDLNAADQAQLMTLPGVGEVLAKRILAYRDQLGAFTDVMQLLQVEGIGKATLEALLDYITIGG